MTRRYILNLPDSVRIEDVQLLLKNFPGASLEPESDESLPGVIAAPNSTEAECQEALNAVIGLWEGRDISFGTTARAAMANKTLRIVLLDTSVLFPLLKREAWMIREFERIGHERAAFSVITHSEALIGCRKDEFRTLTRFFDQYACYELDAGVSRAYRSIIHSHYERSSIWIPDALIAATALYNGLELFTLNRRDFDFIQGLRLYSPTGTLSDKG